MKKYLWMAAMATLMVACVVKPTRTTTVYRKDNGKHKGWYKNPKNPHHPANHTTVVVVEQNNGVSHGNGKAKGKGKK